MTPYDVSMSQWVDTVMSEHINISDAVMELKKKWSQVLIKTAFLDGSTGSNSVLSQVMEM